MQQEGVVPPELTTVKLDPSNVTFSTKSKIPSFAKIKKLNPLEEEVASFCFAITTKEPAKTIEFVARTKEDFGAWTGKLGANPQKKYLH